MVPAPMMMTGIAEATGAGGPVPSKQRARILVVDDEEDVRDALDLLLTGEGFEVFAVASGADAVREAARRDFALAITDLRMPGMSGEDTISALRALRPDLPILVLTGFATDATAAECLRRGACDYVRKPVDVDELAAHVRRYART